MRFLVAPGAVKLVLFSSTGFAVVSYGTDSSFFLKSNPVAGAAVDFAPDMVVVLVVVAEVEGVAVVVGVFVLVTELIYGAKVDFGSWVLETALTLTSFSGDISVNVSYFWSPGCIVAEGLGPEDCEEKGLKPAFGGAPWGGLFVDRFTGVTVGIVD